MNIKKTSVFSKRLKIKQRCVHLLPTAGTAPTTKHAFSIRWKRTVFECDPPPTRSFLLSRHASSARNQSVGVDVSLSNRLRLFPLMNCSCFLITSTIRDTPQKRCYSALPPGGRPCSRRTYCSSRFRPFRNSSHRWTNAGRLVGLLVWLQPRVSCYIHSGDSSKNLCFVLSVVPYQKEVHHSLSCAPMFLSWAVVCLPDALLGSNGSEQKALNKEMGQYLECSRRRWEQWSGRSPFA